MRPIPEALKRHLAADPYYEKCARADFSCRGRITWEHAFIYGGKQINEAWSILPLCEWHHLEGGLDKRENQLIALNRATPEDLARYPNFDWEKRRNYLNNWTVLRS